MVTSGSAANPQTTNAKTGKADLRRTSGPPLRILAQKSRFRPNSIARPGPGLVSPVLCPDEKPIALHADVRPASPAEVLQMVSYRECPMPAVSPGEPIKGFWNC